MDVSHYKDYVLVLLFINYVNDKCAGQRYAPITIPAGASFNDKVALKDKADVNKQIIARLTMPTSCPTLLSALELLGPVEA